MTEDVTEDDGEMLYETVFRKRWRDHQSESPRPGELIDQPGWIDTALVVLCALLAVGAAAAVTMTVERSSAMPAVAQGPSVTAVRGGGEPPAPGTAVQYRDASGSTRDAVVIEVTTTEVIAHLMGTGPASAGELVIPAGRQTLLGVLLPRLG